MPRIRITKELLELDPDGGVIRFVGQRALLLDAVAMGVLRQYLVDNFGLTAARAALTQFGFAHAWRMAAAMKSEFRGRATRNGVAPALEFTPSAVSSVPSRGARTH